MSELEPYHSEIIEVKGRTHTEVKRRHDDGVYQVSTVGQTAQRDEDLPGQYGVHKACNHHTAQLYYH